MARLVSSASLSAAVATAVAATAATPAVTTAIAAAIATATAAPSAATTLLARPGFVYRQGAALMFLPVECINRFLGFVVAFHFDEAEAARAAGFAIGDYLGSSHRAVFFEKSQQVVGRAFPRKVADINILRHLRTFPGPDNQQ